MQAQDCFDADAYLERLQWQGASPAVTLEDLTRLLRAHMRAIPFENLDVLRGLPPRLDLRGVQSKLVGARRGGYCFEHGALFGAALAHFGFDAKNYIARVTLSRPHNQSPRTHHFLVVTLHGQEWLVDPGFGGLAPDRPVPFRSEDQGVGPYQHHLLRVGDYWQLRAQVDGNPLTLWVSQREETFSVDYELGNHYTATFPDSLFVQHLMLRALTAEGRVSVLDRDVTWRQGDVVRRWTLADRVELYTLLVQHFGIDMPEVLQLRVPGVAQWASTD